MQIIHTNPIDRGLKTNLIGFTIMGAALHAAARKPGGKGMGVVITTQKILVLCFLHDGQAAELATAYNQCGIKKPALFQVA